MPEPSQPDPQLLDRYLAGTLTPDERAQVESLLGADATTATMLKALPDAMLGGAAAPDTDASWQRLALRIGAAEGSDDLSLRRERNAAVVAPRPWVRRVARLAAALVVVIAGVGTLRAVRGAGGSLDAPLGHDVSATLPDGTRITIAAGSHVAWPRDYGRSTRDLTLEGEAYFDVVHDASHPFRVHTRDAIAEDVGTRFVIRAWPELAGVDVAVEEGIVALADSGRASAGRATLVRAGQRARLAAGVVTMLPDADVALAWTHGALAFENQPLSEVLSAIGRRFDVDLRADTALAGRRLTARFTAQSLDDVLNALALSLDVTVATDGRTITLSPARR